MVAESDITIVLAFLAAVGSVLAFGISVLAINKAERVQRQMAQRLDSLEWRLRERIRPEDLPRQETPPRTSEPQREQSAPPPRPPMPAPVQEPAAGGREPELPRPERARTLAAVNAAARPPEPKASAESLEQRIGTRWMLIAGAVAVFFGAGFFLKYAYEHFSVGPLGRVLAVAGCGAAALIIGELTRRRGYELAAKGVTALGFALLYVADFAAYRFYGLIGVYPAFALAMAITGGTLVYAVALDEVVIAFLSLLGGYLTPVIVSTGENAPNPLFGYLLVLSVGGMGCAYYRKWRSINLLSFVGTMGLYAIWYGKYYVGDFAYQAVATQAQLPVAAAWLGVFFFVFLLMPVVYELVHRATVGKQDVWLVLINAGATFYFLWSMLYVDHRPALGWCAVALAAVHAAMVAAAVRRCPQDRNFRDVLTAIAVLFVTVAMPLFFRMNTLSVAWAGQATVLALIGVRYRSLVTQAGSLLSLGLGVANLVYSLPMHTGPFEPVANPTFFTWCVVALAAYGHHWVYRGHSRTGGKAYAWAAEGLFVAAATLLWAAAIGEWHGHWRWNLTGASEVMLIQGAVALTAGMILVFAAHPVSPVGWISRGAAGVVMLAGTAGAVWGLTEWPAGRFDLVANTRFGAAAAVVAAIAAAHLLNRLLYERRWKARPRIGAWAYVLACVLGCVVLSAEWLRHVEENLGGATGVYLKGQTLAILLLMGLLVVRPIRPARPFVATLGAVAGLGAAVYAVLAQWWFYEAPFRTFFNWGFAVLVLVAAALGMAAWMLRRAPGLPDGRTDATVLGLTTVVALWILISEQIYLYYWAQNRFAGPVEDWRFLAHMYISVGWAVYGAAVLAAGFRWNSRSLRYMALGLFALLLVKVFVVDTQRVESVYRIGAFTATGLTLVGMSYVYQYLRKKGFFEAMSGGEAHDEQ